MLMARAYTSPGRFSQTFSCGSATIAIASLFAFTTLPALHSTASADASIRFDNTRTRFFDDGPTEVGVGERVSVEVASPRLLENYDLEINYEEPARDQLASAVRTAASLTQHSGGTPTPARAAAAGQELERSLSEFRDIPDCSRLQDVRAKHAELAVALSGAEGTHTNLVQLRDFAYGLLERLDARCIEDRPAPVSLSFTVRGNFHRVVIQLCRTTMTISLDQDREQWVLETSNPRCVESRYSLRVRDPLGPVSILAGVIFPFQLYGANSFRIDESGALVRTRRDDGGAVSPQPVVSLSARGYFPGDARGSLGAEFGLGIGDEIGTLYTLGLVGGVYGISFGAGLWMDTDGDLRANGIGEGELSDRTTSVPLVGVYLGVSLSSDLWDILSGLSEDDGGADNREEANQREETEAEEETEEAEEEEEIAADGGAEEEDAPSEPVVLPSPGA
ncbi:MAG: hypothetical protein SangKO_050040 [Sandaracinaceae bacterium]